MEKLVSKKLKKEHQIFKQNNIDMPESFIDKKSGVITPLVIFKKEFKN